MPPHLRARKERERRSDTDERRAMTNELANLLALLGACLRAICSKLRSGLGSVHVGYCGVAIEREEVKASAEMRRCPRSCGMWCHRSA